MWNECNDHPDTCFCEHTREKFRRWLRRKYGSLKALGEAWYRYSYSAWERVEAPRFQSQSPECMDWLAFRKENYYELYQWKIQILRRVDPDARITAHGVAASLDYTYGDGNDDWLAASQVESYGDGLGDGAQGDGSLEAVAGGGSCSRRLPGKDISSS